MTTYDKLTGEVGMISPAKLSATTPSRRLKHDHKQVRQQKWDRRFVVTQGAAILQLVPSKDEMLSIRFQSKLYYYSLWKNCLNPSRCLSPSYYYLQYVWWAASECEYDELSASMIDRVRVWTCGLSMTMVFLRLSVSMMDGVWVWRVECERERMKRVWERRTWGFLQSKDRFCICK